MSSVVGKQISHLVVQKLMTQFIGNYLRLPHELDLRALLLRLKKSSIVFIIN